jgi:L-malate glycosyltransferase
MNILFLTYQGDMAGSTYSIAALARGLAARGHTIVVGCRRESLLHAVLGGSGVHRVDLRFRGRLVDLETMRAIRDTVRRFGIGIVNAQSSRDRYASILARWLHRLDVRVVHTRRQIPMSEGGRLQSWFYTVGTDLIIAVGTGVKDALVGCGIPAAHIEVIPNGIPPEKVAGIDPERTARIAGALGLAPDDVVIGSVSRRKQHDQLLRAVARLDRPVHVLLVGLERTTADERILASYPLPHVVHFTGPVEPAEALAHLPLLSVNVLPSTGEGLSQSLLEAMAAGVPVVATRASGNTDLITDGIDGFLFEDGDVAGLASILQSLMDGSVDIAAMTARARKTALEDFSLEKTVARYEASFARLSKPHEGRETLPPPTPTG